MGVYIKGMEMPGNCTDCWFRKTARHEYLSDCQLCPFTGDTTPYLTRDKKCPLVPVPPHGDLIDRDALQYEECEYADGSPVFLIEKREVDNAPTIIKAEEGE